MADILSQEEVDALREAVKTGEVLEDADKPGVKNNAGEQVKVAEYNFRKPHLVSADQLQLIRLIHESLSKTLQLTFFTSLRKTVEVKLVAMDQVTFGEYVLSLSNPTYIVTFQAEPDKGGGVMEMSLPVVMAMLNVILGSDGTSAPALREMTVLEKSMFHPLTELCLQDVGHAWANMMDISFKMTGQESSPEYCQVMTSETSCLSMTFDVHLGAAAGIINICYPFSMIRAVLDHLEGSAKKSVGSGAGGASGEAMLKAMGIAPLDLRAVLGFSTISTQQLGLLKTGDILCLDRRVDSPLDLYVGQNLSFKVEAGRHHGKMAVGIVRPCNQKEVKDNKKRAE